MSSIKRSITTGIAITLMFCSGFAQQYNESNDFSYALRLYNEAFYDIAAQQFSTFINRYPSSVQQPDARYYLGDALFRIGEIENARIEFQALAVGSPDHNRAPEAWIKVGECYEALNKPEEAAKAYETVKILYPSDARAPNSLLMAATVYMQIDQLIRAEQIVKEFIDRYLESSEYPRGRILYANILLQKGEFERAGSEFQKVISLTENKNFRAEARLGEAAVYQQLGLTNRAISTLQEILQPQFSTALGFEALTALTRIYQQEHRWEDALNLLRAESSKYTQSKQRNRISLMQARTHFLKGDYFAARRLLEGIDISNNNSMLAITVRFYLACCYREEQKSNDAEREFQAVLKLSLIHI